MFKVQILKSVLHTFSLSLLYFVGFYLPTTNGYSITAHKIGWDKGKEMKYLLCVSTNDDQI